MIKVVLQILILFAPVCLLAQNSHSNKYRIDLGTTKNSPMRGGKVYYTNPTCSYTCGMPGVYIESDNDSIFSVSSGKVCTVFNVGNGDVVVTCNPDRDVFYAYISLKNVNVSKGDTISKGSFIGLLVKTDQDNNYLTFMITNNKGASFSEEKTWELIEQFNESYCEEDKMVYQNNHINHGSDNFRTHK